MSAATITGAGPTPKAGHPVYDQKDLVMSDDKISIAKDGTAKVTVPVSWGAYRLEVVDPSTGLTSSVRFWAGYSWQDNTGGTGAVRPDQVKLKLDKTKLSRR
ncbi:Uncharacterised protein [Morganella morganii]|nr:Uncharacterised protein [Morganella morganii]